MKFSGLTTSLVSQLQKTHGPNKLPVKTAAPTLYILTSQFKSPIIYLILIAALVSLFLGEYLDALLILVVVVINVTMGFVQEFSAKKTFESLTKVIIPQSTVVRNGKMVKIETSSLVPGDVVILGSGDRVPADGRLLEGITLFVSEAVLTGEEEPVEKSLHKDADKLFMGTEVLTGRGTMEVEKIGLSTEIGKIGKSLEEISDDPTPLQIKLKSFAKTLSIIIIALSIVIFIVGILNGNELFSMLKFAIILGVASIPEGLPIAVTVVLTLGMRRVLKKQGLVKRLLSIETLGSTSVICTDKTGTLTEGIMRVTTIDTSNRESTLRGLSLLNTRRTSLEVAIWEYLQKEPDIRPQKVIDSADIIYEEVFDSQKKYAMTVAKIQSSEEAFIIGAPDIIIDFCTSDTDKDQIMNEFDKMAEAGLRVVGLIHKNGGDLKDKAGFAWLALIGINDPVRTSVNESIALAQEAHIKIKMVTGDYLATAIRVAEKVGLIVNKENVLEGKDLEKISVEKLREIIDGIVVFARVSPQHKLKIVEALQANGEVVAMTGDGVNDALALKKADIGVVVGTATDVAKESGDLILLDNNFKTIVAACEEGRLIFSNLKKVIGYALSNSFVEMVLIFGAVLLGLPFPLTVLQILWIQIVNDGPPDILLGFEPKEEGLMDLHPQDIQKDKILDKPSLFLIFAVSLTIGLTSLYFFNSILSTSNDLILARSVTFAIVGMVALFYIFSFKNLRRNIFSFKFFTNNKPLLLGEVYGFTLLYLAIYFPPISRVLEIKAFPVFGWVEVFFVALLSVGWVELVKFITHRNVHNHAIQPTK